MSISRTFAWFAALSLPVLIAMPNAGAQTAASTQDPCAKAYAAKHWDDVISVCGQETTNAGHAVYTSTNQTKEERVAQYNTLINGTLYIAQAYAATGNGRLAQVNLTKANLWIQLAKQQGVATDSKEYQSWQHAFSATKSALGSSSSPYP